MLYSYIIHGLKNIALKMLTFANLKALTYFLNLLVQNT